MKFCGWKILVEVNFVKTILPPIFYPVGNCRIGGRGQDGRLHFLYITVRGHPLQATELCGGAELTGTVYGIVPQTHQKYLFSVLFCALLMVAINVKRRVTIPFV